MITKEMENAVVVEDVRDFDTDHIFDCGQCFRWNREPDGKYTGIAFGRPVKIGYDNENERLVIYNSDLEDFENIWRKYLDLDRDYSYIKKELSENDEIMARAVEYGHGIRILNQDKWETLVSFIISQNNNIPRIKKCIESLAVVLGNKAGEYEGRVFYNIPGPEVLAEASISDLGPCRLGYRAEYLIKTANKVIQDGVGSLDRLGSDEVSSEEVFETLKTYCGVGPKVANCIALFSMGRTDRFPIDVWVRKVMNRLYGIPENDMRQMTEFAASKFGEYGGIAQQYLFYYITHSREVK